MSEPDYENMSDEDFLKLESPAPSGSLPQETEAEPEEIEAEGEDAAAAGSAADVDHTTSHHSEASHTEASEQAEGAEAETLETAEADEPAEGEAVQAAAPVAAPAADAEAVNYEAAYKQIMAPFKANGSEFAPASPEEAIRLMQMGANYTKKMQALAPNLKLMRMLDNNGLLEEQKLSFLIDLSKKDQGAIQKLLADSKIDPLDLNTSEAPAYKPGNHTVSDQEMAFHDTLNDVMSHSAGQETVRWINTQWDPASKDAVFREPALLSIMAEQRANGIAERITTEIDRQRMLGNLTNVPFIQAYKQVGDILHAQGKLVPRASTTPSITPPAAQPRVLETRTAAPKSPVSNGDAARAASLTRTAPKPAPKTFDVFAMSDDEIMAISMPGAR